MAERPVIIAGAGIAGLAMALTLEQIGVDCLVLESVRELKPLGVGINIQPNAVRELLEMGVTSAELGEVGLPAREWALVGLNGNDIYSEPRGLDAGYNWPQYAVHRGRFQMLLAARVRQRLGDAALRTGCRVTGYENREDGVTVFAQTADGEAVVQEASLLIAADGLHSAVRARMHPAQPPIHWGGAIMWRGTSPALPMRSGSSFIGLGTDRQRMVIYPISAPDPATGLAETNWIAEVTVDNEGGWQEQGWFKPVPVSDFVHHFESWRWDWLDVPAMIEAADTAWVNPMIDRDPAPFWNDGRVILIGDAAHPMYPTGSNGASQAIVDARQLGAALIRHGLTAAALNDYNDRFCKPVGELVLRNRGAGPFGLLRMVEERSGGEFEDIEAVVPRAEREAFMAGYKQAAGFSRDQLNSAPPIIPAGTSLARGKEPPA